MMTKKLEKMGRVPQSTGCKVSEQYLKRTKTGRTVPQCDAVQVLDKNACTQWKGEQGDTGRTSNGDNAMGTRGAITQDGVK